MKNKHQQFAPLSPELCAQTVEKGQQVVNDGVGGIQRSWIPSDPANLLQHGPVEKQISEARSGFWFIFPHLLRKYDTPENIFLLLRRLKHN